MSRLRRAVLSHDFEAGAAVVVLADVPNPTLEARNAPVSPAL